MILDFISVLVLFGVEKYITKDAVGVFSIGIVLK